MTSPYRRLIAPTELTDCLCWALPAYSHQRAAWIVERLTAFVNSGGVSQIVAAAAMRQPAQPLESQGLLAVAIALPQAAGAATLLVLHSAQRADADALAKAGKARAAGAAGEVQAAQTRCELARCALEPVVRRLGEQGVTFLQAACDGPDQADLLCSAGFRHLADLSLMALPAQAYDAVRLASPPAVQSIQASLPSQWIALDAIGPGWAERFSSVAARTFAQTRDCPRLNAFRTAEEVVRGFVEAPNFNPALSRLLRLGDRWAGCLVLTTHRHPQPQTSATGTPSDDALELTYMGLVPECRRQGLSSTLLAETVAVARHCSAARIVLAVDQENRPAVSSYRRWGWRQVAGESVWALRITP